MNASTQRLGAATAQTVGDLLDQSIQLGTDLLDLLARQRPGSVGQLIQRVQIPRHGCGCDIPPPCWYPEDLGEVRSNVCPGGTASIRFVVRNCGPLWTTVRFRSSGDDAGVLFAPTELDLEGLARGVVVASLAVPPDAAVGSGREVLVRVTGCKEHVVRWLVAVHRRGSDSCHELDVEDCPDVIHHWYDHFYCQHPCPGRRVG